MKAYWFGVLCRVLYYFTCLGVAVYIVAVVAVDIACVEGSVPLYLTPLVMLSALGLGGVLALWLDFGYRRLQFRECEQVVELPELESLHFTQEQRALAEEILGHCRLLPDDEVWDRQARRLHIRYLMGMDVALGEYLRSHPDFREDV